jgi:hypothetical protein
VNVMEPTRRRAMGSTACSDWKNYHTVNICALQLHFSSNIIKMVNFLRDVANYIANTEYLDTR